MNDIFEELGFELGQDGNATTATQVFDNVNDAVVTLIDLKSDIIEAGFEAQTESVQGSNVVCAFSNGEDTITVIQDTATRIVTVTSTVE